MHMDVEAMRRTGYAAVDTLVTRLAHARSDPVLRRATPAEMHARLAQPPPAAPTDLGEIVERVFRDVLPFASRTDHPGYFAFIPSFTTWPAALAEFIAAVANPYCGAWMESAAAAQVELEVIGWFREWLGLPHEAAGVLVSGGSAANLTALLVARDAAGGPSPQSVVYLSDQAHSSLARTARAMGLGPRQIRILPTDDQWRLQPATVQAAVRADRAAGRRPFAVCASAGSTNTGAVDPLDELADVCAQEDLWLHVDAAYGGFATLTKQGRALLAGIERADSVTLDPHKWLYQPMECGCVIVRDGTKLERSFAIHPDYLEDNDVGAQGEVNFADRGLQLSRGFRALKIWMSVQTFGLDAFRDAIQHNLDLAVLAERLVRERPTLSLSAAATLGIICFRREWPDVSEDEVVARNLALVTELERSGAALVSTTRLTGQHAIRLCVLNPTSTEADIRRVVDHFAEAEPPVIMPTAVADMPGRSDIVEQTRAAWMSAVGELGEEVRAVPLLADVSDSSLNELLAAARLVEVDPGQTVVRRWDSDRDFYVVLSGRFTVESDRDAAWTLSAGEFFGELAARDWGGGYGYARLAAVRCAQAGRLLLVPQAAFQELLECEPALRRRLDAVAAERLNQLRTR